ncbi:unnamed protein product [Fraxinus pennsylvanica]|uniref:Uncharacterized protein n=1 Tax=Fraxinus pennsylvanica TaxID=56036 RepID=A0AAD1ZQ53_9LAMI|nr:unnamed protein product [Fraxinus pennsylvanica]
MPAILPKLCEAFDSLRQANISLTTMYQETHTTWVENGDLHVGIQRVNKGIRGGPDLSSQWNTGVSNSVSSTYRGFSDFIREQGNLTMGNVKKVNENCSLGLREIGKVRAESVIEALALLCALGVSYAVLILHASFRKLSPAKQSQRDGNRRIDQR